MATQVRKQRSAQAEEQAEIEDVEVPPAADLTETDELLAEIDAALEGLDQDLALTYVQVGGE